MSATSSTVDKAIHGICIGDASATTARARTGRVGGGATLTASVRRTTLSATNATSQTEINIRLRAIGETVLSGHEVPTYDLTIIPSRKVRVKEIGNSASVAERTSFHGREIEY